MIQAQIAVESSWNHAAVSDEGCIGLMQIHPVLAVGQEQVVSCA
jgi:soluble lytic murein transglycosylase-like protein